MVGMSMKDNGTAHIKSQIDGILKFPPLGWVRVHEFSKKRRSPKRSFFFFVAKLGHVVRIMLLVMTIAKRY